MHHLHILQKFPPKLWIAPISTYLCLSWAKFLILVKFNLSIKFNLCSVFFPLFKKSLSNLKLRIYSPMIISRDIFLASWISKLMFSNKFWNFLPLSCGRFFCHFLLFGGGHFKAMLVSLTSSHRSGSFWPAFNTFFPLHLSGWTASTDVFLSSPVLFPPSLINYSAHPLNFLF